MDGARLRSCGHFVLAAVVAFALAMSLPLYGSTTTSQAGNASAAYEGPADGAHQISRKAETIHRPARPAKTRSSSIADGAVSAAPVGVERDHQIALIQPTGYRQSWHASASEAARGRAPPA